MFVRYKIIFKDFRKLNILKNVNILEIGCGIGMVSGLLISLIFDGNFVGCDIFGRSIEIVCELNL